MVRHGANELDTLMGGVEGFALHKKTQPRGRDALAPGEV